MSGKAKIANKGLSQPLPSEGDAAVSKAWSEAMAAMPTSRPPCCDPATLARWRYRLGLPSTLDEMLVRMAERVQHDQVLKNLTWYFHWRLFKASIPGPPIPPKLDARLGEDTGLWWMMVAMGFFPAVSARHRALGYPLDVTRATLAQVTDAIATHQAGTGRPGCYPGQVCWLRSFLDSPYVRLGRLAFQATTFADRVMVLRRKIDGVVMAVAQSGFLVDAAGLGARPGHADAWSTAFESSEKAIIGHTISPLGHVQRQRIPLDPAEWEVVLRHGSPILSIHIPPGGGMTPEAAANSLALAIPFFARHHPEIGARAFWCSTWFLDPRLQGLLPRIANPLWLQRCLYLYPISPTGDGGLWHVFLGPTDDPQALPRKTSLQRALANHLACGQQWNGGGGFLLFDDVRVGGPVEGRYARGYATIMGSLTPDGSDPGG